MSYQDTESSRSTIIHKGIPEPIANVEFQKAAASRKREEAAEAEEKRLHLAWISEKHIITEKDVLDNKVKSGIPLNTAEKAALVEYMLADKLPDFMGNWFKARQLGRGIQEMPEPNWKQTIEQRYEAQKKEEKRVADVMFESEKIGGDALRETMSKIPGGGIVMAAIDKGIPDLPGDNKHGILYEIWMAFLEMLVSLLNDISGPGWDNHSATVLVEVLGGLMGVITIVLPLISALK